MGPTSASCIILTHGGLFRCHIIVQPPTGVCLSCVSVRIAPMVRPERRGFLAGGSPVRVSAGAPGSRLQAGGEIRPYEAECQEPLKERGASKRAATSGEGCSLVKLSAERCLGGPSRSCHGEGNRQHSLRPDGMLALSGVLGVARLQRISWNRRDPTRQPCRAKTGHIRPEGGKCAEPGGSPRGS
jgi:hypothetical protein